MENYLRFATPETIDIRMAIIWLCASAVILLILLFLLWKADKPRNIYPNLATMFGVIGLAILPAIVFGAPVINENRMTESIETNYGVNVMSHEDGEYLINIDGSIRPCTIHVWEETSYYALCEVPGGRLLLNDILDDAKQDAKEETAS